jgi:hypothetical protein
MVECLHEIGLPQPIYHNPKPQPAAKDEKKAAPAASKAAPAATKPAEKSSDTSAVKEEGATEKPKAGEPKAGEKKGDFGDETNPFGS